MGLYNPAYVVNARKNTIASTVRIFNSTQADNILLKATNSNRHQVIIFNEGNEAIYVNLSATANDLSFTVKVLSNGAYITPENYTGNISAATDSAYNIMVTELTYS
ncbi:MAG: hypothetical protein WBA07_33670 [Rivularia sp. (in: cyanobacteria)]